MRLIGACLLTFALLGCSEAETPADETAVADAETIGAEEKAPEQEGNPFARETSGPDTASCPEENGLTCAGAILIKAGNVNLARNRKSFAVTGSLQFSNRERESVQFAFVDNGANLRLDNGAQFETRTVYAFPGKPYCSPNQNPTECANADPESFILLEPTDSATDANFSFISNTVPESLMPSMADVETGTLNFTIYVIDAAGSKRRRDISISNIPITPRM